jgi:hypothetical protein
LRVAFNKPATVSRKAIGKGARSELRFPGIRSKRPEAVEQHGVEASWRSGYAEDCKSLHPGSIPGEASIDPLEISRTSRTPRRAGSA